MAADKGLTEENRKTPRLKAFKAGRIVFHHGGSTIDCTIRNLSDAGAKLTLEQALLAPDRFQLQFQDGTMPALHRSLAQAHRDRRQFRRRLSRARSVLASIRRDRIEKAAQPIAVSERFRSHLQRH